MIFCIISNYSLDLVLLKNKWLVKILIRSYVCSEERVGPSSEETVRCLEQWLVKYITTAVSGTANGNSPAVIRLIHYFHIF